MADAAVLIAEPVCQGHDKAVRIFDLRLAVLLVHVIALVVRHLLQQLLILIALLRQDPLHRNVIPQIGKGRGIGKAQTGQGVLEHIGRRNLVQIQGIALRIHQIGNLLISVFRRHLIVQGHHRGDLQHRLVELIEQQGGTDSHQQAQNQHPGKNPALHLHVVEDIAQVDGVLLLVRVGYDQIDLGIVIQQRPVLLPVFFQIHSFPSVSCRTKARTVAPHTSSILDSTTKPWRCLSPEFSILISPGGGIPRRAARLFCLLAGSRAGRRNPHDRMRPAEGDPPGDDPGNV